MTVKYKGNLFLSLFHWKGSVWKAIWIQLLLWIVTYFAIRIILYILIFKHAHDKLVWYSFDLKIRDYPAKLPLELILGFYMNQVLNRWWAQVQYNTLK